MEKNLTRKEFLANTSKYAVGAAVGITGLNMLSGGKVLANPEATWPLPYAELDTEKARDRAHFLYYNGMDCCSGVFGAVLDQLKEKFPAEYGAIPTEIMLFGRGGGNGWGTICGTINGGAAVISMCVDKASSGPLINELWGWYCQTALPSTESNDFAAAGKFTANKYNGTLVQNVSGSPLCHASVSQWCIAASKKVGDTERKERCARIAADTAVKVIELLNAFYAKTFTATFTPNSDVTTCGGCHGSSAMYNVMTQMACNSCHTDAHQSTTGNVEALSGVPAEYQISQNYPNPFNPTTTIQFAVPQNDKVHLAVYDIQGSLVKTIVDHEAFNRGKYSVQWDGKDSMGNKVASGIYFARISAGGFMHTIKMSLMK